MSTFPTFAAFYEAVHGFAPFKWQDELAQQVWERKSWPEQVAAPTGAGKTSTLDIAVWALAKDVAEHGVGARHFPLRIFLTVERRLVVDGAAAHGAIIANRLETQPQLAPVRDALRQLLPRDHKGPVLRVTSLHGGKAPEREWLTPVGAQIITATVTQLASRTLFRGVSVSPRTLSMHAGLTGVDRLILIDEPHLAPAAVKMWREVEQLQRQYPRSPLVGSTVVLGATIPESLRSVDCFIGSLAEDPSPAAKARLGIKKPVRLVETSKPVDELVAAAETAFQSRSQDPDSDGVLVVVNTVKRAVDVAKKLRTKLKRSSANVVLLTSTVRPIDRVLPDDFTPDTVIVATQTVEVGVDIDAEVLVTELPSLPALVQRFGRVNRTGLRQQRESTVVIPVKPDGAAKSIYGREQMQASRDSLFAQAEDGLIGDASTLVVPSEAWEPDPRTCSVEEYLPRLTSTRPPAQVPWEALAFGPDATDRASVTLAWRENLDEILDQAQVFPDETIAIPIGQAQAFLSGKSSDAAFADTVARSGDKPKSQRITINCRIRVGEEWVQPESISQVEPDALVVISASEGGYSPETGFSTKLQAPVEDQSMQICVQQGRGFFDIGLLDEQDLFMLAEQLGLEPADLILQRIAERFSDVDVENLDVVLSGRAVGVRYSTAAARRTPKRVTLADHSVQTSQLAEQYATLSGIPDDMVEAVSRAGLLHDAGKVDPGFQHSFGNYLPEPVAKPVGRVMPSLLDRGQTTWRHEVLSATAVRGDSFADELVRHLILSHHGWARRLSPHDGTTYTNSLRYRLLEEQFGPWGVALYETMLRSADWAASASPRSGLAESWESLNIHVNPNSLVDVSEYAVTHVFTGPRPYSLTMLLAGIGALASCVRNGDTSAKLRVVDGKVELSSTVDPSWDMQLYNSMAFSLEVGAGFKSPDGTLCDSDAKDRVKGRNKWYLQHRQSALEQCPEAAPLFFDAFTDDGESRLFSIPIFHGNGKPYFAIVTDDPVQRTQSLYDPTIGLVDGKGTGGLDVNTDDRFSGDMDRRYSEDHLAWAIAGMVALGMPGDENGSGVRDRQLTLTAPTEWSTLEEIQDFVMSPISTLPIYKWRDQPTRQSGQIKVWEPIMDSS